MKVCLVAPRVGKVKGAFLGGSVNNIVNLSKELAKRHEVFLVTTPPIGASRVKGIDWCDVYELKCNINDESLVHGFEFLIKTARLLKNIHAKEKFHVINLHSSSPKLGLVSRILDKSNTSIVHTIYSPITPPSNVDRRRHNIISYYGLFSHPRYAKLYFSNVDAVIAISRNVAISVSRVFKKRIKIIPPCINLSSFTAYGSNFGRKCTLKEELGLANEKVVLFLGEREAKGIDIFLKAIKEVRKRVEIKAIIVAGYEIYNVREKIKEIEDTVILLDIVDMAAIMAISDLFVAPILSTFDVADCPLSILEAMAAGKPVIASNIGGIPEIIRHGETGILIKPNDVSALANAIIFLIEHEEVAKNIGRKGCENVRDFDCEKICKRYESFYEELSESVGI